MAFKRCSIGTKGPKVCQENIPHTITPPRAWTVETRQDGSMLSCSLCQILTQPSERCSRNRDSSDQATFFQSSIVQFWWPCVNCSLRNTQTSPSGTNNHSMFKVTYIPFLPHSDARFELQQVVFTTSRCLNALSCCHVIGWLAICVTKQLNRCT